MNRLEPKKKLCTGCNQMTFLWKANPPMCKDCVGREKESGKECETKEKLRKVSLKMKPKARVNGKPLHTALYMAAFGYGDADYVPSELSGNPCVDVHHIDCKGSGGTKTEDRIENLIGLTREEHSELGDKTQWMAMLYTKHRDFMEANGVKFDREWIDGQINKYIDEYLNT